MSDTTEQQARETVLRLLARREHSQLELRQKLRQRGFTQTQIEAALNYVGERGYQSDRRFAESWLRQSIAKGDGPTKIAAAAQHKGIRSELLNELLDELEPDWFQLCAERLFRKFGEQPPTDRKQRDKIIRHLLQRGFRYEQVQHALQLQSECSTD
ncbi:regulatory protein RecX [Pseudidiomarina taiwanensis]|uniref:Regulatory protein RecX n=1 Tax=Pseudidiomarina taiwanensis TaxID=337250 RepID=A0A432ZMD5_9GAMM|nr:regulatory protein RecX [Pseudidiomarina taiwanensis]RUO79030.1 OraA [Pseudidiomarina taiwanensis]